MLHLVQTERSYPPETVSAMTDAFDRVCRSLSTRINGNEAVRKTLALTILRHVDQGQRDAKRLAALALHELAGNDRSEISDRSAP